MVSTLLKKPQALYISALAALGTLQPRAFSLLIHVDPLNSACNDYFSDILNNA